MDQPVYEFRTTRRIEFVDTDMGGIVHFSRFAVFMEAAEHAFLRSLGWSVHFQSDDGEVGWPRAESWCRYHSPARFNDVLDLHLRIVRKGTKSLTYETTFTNQGTLVARGRITAVCCLLGGSEGLRSIPIPQALSQKIIQAPTAPLPESAS